MDEFCRQFEAAIPELQKKILDEFNLHQTQAGFRSVWEHFEEVINPVLINFFASAPLLIPKEQIHETKSKSTYPDLKVSFEGKTYAIDVKSGETKHNPWYDISRIDTYEKEHFDKYTAEYSVVISWSGRTALQVDAVYIEPVYKTVGYRAESKGVLYRPYDGKLRPKPWKDFREGKSYWHDINHFKEGLAASKAYRRRSFILEWYEKMTPDERQALKQDIARIEAGEEVQRDEVLEQEKPI